MELQARRREAIERCPYCHDLIVGAPDLTSELIECAGCGTQHHEVCLVELGRCTVRGCERPIVVARTPERDARLAARSAIYREVHRRLTARARTYVRNNCRPAGESAPIQEDEALPFRGWRLANVQQVLLGAYRARREERWAEAAAGFEEAEHLIASMPDLVDAGQLSTTIDDTRALARAMRRCADGERDPIEVGALALLALLVVAVLLLLAWIALSF